MTIEVSVTYEPQAIHSSEGFLAREFLSFSSDAKTIPVSVLEEECACGDACA